MTEMTDAEFLRWWASVPFGEASDTEKDRLESIAASLEGVRVSVEDARRMQGWYEIYRAYSCKTEADIATYNRLRTLRTAIGEKT